MANSKTLLLANIVLFQLAWFSLVLGYAALGIALSVALLALVLFTSKDRKKEIVFSLMVIILGVVSDSVLMHYQVYTFAFGLEEKVYSSVIPIWLVSLWLAFSFTLNHSLKWLLSMPMVFLPLMTLFGPLSYFAGSQLHPEQIQIQLNIFYWAFVQWSLVAIAIFFSARHVLTKNSE